MIKLRTERDTSSPEEADARDQDVIRDIVKYNGVKVYGLLTMTASDICIDVSSIVCDETLTSYARGSTHL